MKIILIEDEVHARESLKKMLNLVNPKTKVLFESGHISNCIKFLKANTVDLFFLDLHLEDGTGFDLLNSFPNRSFKVIITTAYDDKAVEAYRLNTADYLLKPINPYDLEDAIKRVKKQLKLEELTKKVKEPLTLKTTNSFIRILPSDIIHLIVCITKLKWKAP